MNVLLQITWNLLVNENINEDTLINSFGVSLQNAVNNLLVKPVEPVLPKNIQEDMSKLFLIYLVIVMIMLVYLILNIIQFPSFSKFQLNRIKQIFNSLIIFCEDAPIDVLIIAVEEDIV